MKNFIVLVVLGFSFSLLNASWFSLDSTKGDGTEPTLKIIKKASNELTFELEIPGFYLNEEVVNGEKYTIIKLPQAEKNAIVGKPEVPHLGYLLNVPTDGKSTVEVVDSNSIVIENINLMPVREQAKRCGKNYVPRLIFDRNVFNASLPYPAQVVEISENSNLRNYLISRLSLYPIQYNPANYELIAYNKITFTVHFNGTSMRQASYQKNSNAFNEVFSKYILNYDTNRNRAVVPGKDLMLIISNDEYVTSPQSKLNEFVAWKKRLGIDVVVKKVSEIGNVNTKIKDFIQNAYNSWPISPTYLLFVGNETTVVTFKRPTESGNAASDYYYSLLSGNDIYPDILYGRVVANNVSDVNIILNKIMNYEKNPKKEDWYKKAIGIASSEQGSGPSDVQYIKDIESTLKANTYSVFDEFFQANGNANTTNINKSLNEGRSWVTYIGHGSGTSWASTNDDYSNASINQLKNSYKLPIIIDVACENGQYDSSFECFGERWVRMGTVDNPAGAVAYWGGSVSISWDPPAIMAKGIAIRHFKDPVHTLGGSLIAGQLYLSQNWNKPTEVEDNFEWYNLFGDPSMNIRTDIPKDFNISSNDIIAMSDTQYNVTVKDQTGKAIEKAHVALYDPSGTLVSSGLTGKDGALNLTFKAFGSAKDVELVVNEYNFVPFTKTVKIGGGGPGPAGTLTFLKDQLVNESLAKDGKPNPGEELTYDLFFKNTDANVFSNVKVVFTTESQYVESFPNSLDIISAMSNVETKLSGFTFKMKKDVPNNTVVEFVGTWTAGTQSGNFKLSYTVAAEENDVQIQEVAYQGQPMAIQYQKMTMAMVDGPKGVIKNMRIYVDLKHDRIGDIAIYIYNPLGERVALRKRVGGTNSLSIVGWYPTDFESLEPLSLYFKETSGGKWKILVTDNNPLGDGILNSFKIEFSGKFAK